MLVTRKKIEKLHQINNSNCISLYIKTHRSGHTDADRIRWKNACNEAADKLMQQNMEEKDVRKLLRPATDLLKQDDFWLHLSDGLGMFINENIVEKFILPVNFNNRVFVDEKFIVSPLLLLFNNRQRFFLLDLSLNQIRFFEGNKHFITPVKIDDLTPTSIEESSILQNKEITLQMNSTGIIHGHGGVKELKEKQIEKYLRLIDNGMQEIYREEKVPLVLSGTLSIVSQYKNISKYKYILDTSIVGNNEHTDPILLHEKAYKIVKSEYLPSDKDKLEEYSQYTNTAQSISEFEDIEKALEQKNISKLYVSTAVKDIELETYRKVNHQIMNAFTLGAEIIFFEKTENPHLLLGVKHF